MTANPSDVNSILVRQQDSFSTKDWFSINVRLDSNHMLLIVMGMDIDVKKVGMFKGRVIFAPSTGREPVKYLRVMNRGSIHVDIFMTWTYSDEAILLTDEIDVGVGERSESHDM